MTRIEYQGQTWEASEIRIPLADDRSKLAVFVYSGTVDNPNPVPAHAESAYIPVYVPQTVEVPDVVADEATEEPIEETAE